MVVRLQPGAGNLHVGLTTKSRVMIPSPKIALSGDLVQIVKSASVALLLFWMPTANTAPSTAWVKFGENERLVAYYESATSSASGTVTVWVLFDYKAEQESPRSGRRYFSQKGQQELDCHGQRSRTVFFTWHTGGMGEGAVVYTGSKALPWEPNSPGSIARALSSAVCLRK